MRLVSTRAPRNRVTGPHGARRRLVPLVLAVVTAVLVGCAGAPGTPAPDEDSGPVRLTFWTPLRGMDEVVQAFNDTHSDVQVDFRRTPAGLNGGYAQLSNAARAGNAPDVATVEYPQVAGFAVDGALRDVSDLMDPGLRERLLPQALQQTTFEGRTYAIPQDIGPMVLLYRRDLFERHGLTVPETWAEFRSVAEQVRRAAPGAHLVNFPPDSAQVFTGLAWQAGSRWFDTGPDGWRISLSDEPTRRVADYWQSMVDDDLASHVSDQEINARIGRDELFAQVTANWGAGQLMATQESQAGDWAVAPLPQWDPRDPATGGMGGSTFAVTEDSAHPEEALQFVEWLVSDPLAWRTRLDSGISTPFPADRGIVGLAQERMDREFFGGQDVYAEFARQAALVRPEWSWGPRMSSTLTTLQDAFARAVSGDGTLADAVELAGSASRADLTALGLDVAEREADR